MSALLIILTPNQRKAFWAKKNEKRSHKREILEENKQRGKAGEELYKINSILRGVEIQRTGKGSDFKERPMRFPWQKPTKWRKVDVKTGDAKLSKLQKKNKTKVVRMDPYFGLDRIGKNIKFEL